MPFFPDLPPVQVQKVAAETAEQTPAFEIKLPHLPRHQTRFTVIASSSKGEQSYENDKGGGSLFNSRLFQHLERCKGLKAATDPLIGKDINDAPDLTQTPRISGDPIHPDLLNFDIPQRVAAIHIVGRPKVKQSDRTFMEDRARFKRYCDRREIPVTEAGSFGEFENALDSVSLLASGDILVVAYSGHSTNTLLSRRDDETGRAGVLALSGKQNFRGFENVEFVHEARIMRKIGAVVNTGQFYHVIFVVDGCEAEEFDTFQFVQNDDPKLVTVIDESLLPPLKNEKEGGPPRPLMPPK